MQVKNYGVCTVGMMATLDGTDGFITAGQCADGEKCSKVGQDAICSVIGTATVGTHDSDSNETCDCAFVGIDSGSRTMDASSHWDPYYLTSAADVNVVGFVKITGKGFVWQSSFPPARPQVPESECTL